MWYGETHYFKIKRDTLDYLAIYSMGRFDPKVMVYDDFYTLVDRNDDVDPNSRGAIYTSGKNFYCQFYADRDRYYYFGVKPALSGATGTTTIRCVIDNFHVSDYSKLVSGINAVKNGRIYYKDYTNLSYYISIGAAQWNKLGQVQIRHRGAGDRTDLTLNLFYDKDSIVAYTSKHWLKGWSIWYNDYYFQDMVMSERLKTVMHEFGHTLGMAEFSGWDYCESYDNVMVQGIRSISKLGPADIAVYRKLWG